MDRLPWWLGTILAGFLAAALTVNATTAQDSPYLTILWLFVVILSLLFAGSLTMQLWLQLKKYRNAIQIIDADWRCTYWPDDKQLQVILWFNDLSFANSYETGCIAQFGQEAIKLDDRIEMGRSYMARNGLVSGYQGPVMAEFTKRGVELDKPTTAPILVRIKPSGGKGARKQRIKIIPVQVIHRRILTYIE